MERQTRERTRLARSTLVHAAAAGLLLATVVPAPAAAEDDPPWLTRCTQVARSAADDGMVLAPWNPVLDEEGSVVAHEMTLRRGEQEVTLRTGWRGFAIPLGPSRLLVGERSDDGTRLAMLDVHRVCRLWARKLDVLVFPQSGPGDERSVRLAVHAVDTRAYRGSLALDIESGASGGLIDGVCIADCEPNDGEVTLADFEPAGAPQPVPSFPAGGWPQDRTLTFAWLAGATPPTWARDALKAGAADATETAAARSPRFVYRSDGRDSVAYGGALPTYCGRNGIACAARSMPSFWGVWLRPHGTEFAWGRLRWCQKDSGDGCFDIRRVLLHELGHVAGLHHPSSAGFTLGAHETVMHAITPQRPKAGSSRHAFGRCDVATLQELYDTPDNKSAISTCNDVATVLALEASRTAVSRGASVTLTAELRVANRDAYGKLAGNPLNGRSVKLRWRRAGSDDAWSTAWMRPLYSTGRYELTIAPQATWEYEAAFPAPVDEGLRYSRSDTLKVKVD